MIFPVDRIQNADEALAFWETWANDLIDDGVTTISPAIVRTVVESIMAIRAKELGGTMTFAEAARETGYSEKQVRRWVRKGEIADVGLSGSPRVRRGDVLARSKATSLQSAPAVASLRSAQDTARSIAKGRRR